MIPLRILPLLLPALVLAPGLPSPADAVISVPPVPYLGRTLANGLRVYELPDATATTASVQVWYDVGSKDDPTGRSGFAHLFEHLMFKATRNMPSEMIDRLTEDVGGSNNASTDDDYTEYHESAPANHLERLIWAEAERMGGLVVDQANFAAERDVVKEELRGDLARPYGELFAAAYPIVNYQVSPYARPTIGSVADLDAATLDDVRTFHALYYRPDNAVLVVAGRFDPKTLDGWIDRTFGAIARPAWPIPRTTPAEPPRTAPRRYVARVPNTPAPAVAISWLLPHLGPRDRAAVTMIDGLLSGGAGSRFYHALVYRDRIAAEADLNADFKKSVGTINAYAMMASGHSAAEGEAALRREIARIRDEPVSEAELARVRNLIVTAALKQRETIEGRASLIASTAIMDGDPGVAERRMAEIAKVTPADVQRVARGLFADKGAVTLHYLSPQSAPTDRGLPIRLAATVRSAALVAPPQVPIVTALAPELRTPPPVPGPAVAPLLPQPAERRLSNGIRLIVMERHALPIVTVHLVSHRGTADDPADRAGLAGLTADLLDKGTTSRDATDIARTIEAMGGEIDGDAARDGSTVSLTVKADELDPAMRLFADVALNPSFTQSEIDRARTQSLDQLRQAYQTPASLAGLAGARAVYGDAPYGKPEDGTPASLRAITRSDLVASYRATWQPATTTLVMAGDITVDRAAALAERLFGRWQGTTSELPPAREAAHDRPRPAPRTIVIDFPGATQAVVLMMRATIRRDDPAYYPLLVANAALGGGYSSRLNREVRVKRGLAYGASSSFSAGRLPGPLSVTTQTRNESVPAVVRIMADEMKGMGADPLGATELAARKAALIGGFGETIETTDGLAGATAALVEHDLAPTELDHYAERIAAVTPADIQRASRVLLDPAAASIVIVGDAKRFLPALRQQGLRPQLIPARAVIAAADGPISTSRKPSRTAIEAVRRPNHG